nr:uncharacterized protein LOC116432279 isoform X1 [Nomia melanderi]XP_031844751.1 uncharacterized protein LOC116432279 isoform X1 [Nomia melanderi]XP_031844752.1 uncharacterized protein LOC116432279 isoform X1 [Nomia melanderi]XP_031844753.1 uncharacterized protein LOC116432279 isoform X1 [Nomia melanderi]XP_031844754.1 uncharacterized protein LOC116432279 isoform X1 [Nomia melanderi]
MKKMLQLPVIFVLIISMFVASVPVDTSHEDGHDKSAVDTTTNVNNGAVNITTDSNTTTVAPLVQAAENKTGNLNSKISEPSQNVTKANETVPQHIEKANENKKHKCNSTKEQDDMQGCYVLPHDSEEDTDDNLAGSTPVPTPVTTDVTKKTEVNKTKASTDEIKINVQKKNESVDVYPLNSTETTQSVTYDIVSTEASNVKNTSSTEGSLKPTVKPTTANDTTTSNPVEPPMVNKITSVESDGTVTEVKSADRNKSMPSGVIALVIAISFGVAIAIVYIGMIVWRRYIEYRYGHRELLVNELEFDTNDLRHFEL